MTATSRCASWRTTNTLVLAIALALALLSAACGGSDDASSTTSTAADRADQTGQTASSEASTPAAPASTDEENEAASSFSGELRIGAIPDQDPEKLARLYGELATYLGKALPSVDVTYVPVTDYQGAVSGFKVGDLDLVWFGGLTGVQARLEVDGAKALVQRDIDAEFTSVFIANTSTGIEPFDSLPGLQTLAGHSFTFGSESSTSGRLMPQSFLTGAGVEAKDAFRGPAGFSGSHDKTIELVESGTYETGVLNSQVWDSRVAEGKVDPAKVIEVFRTPAYYDYHWVAQPDLDARFGEGFEAALVDAFLALDASDPAGAAILELFAAKRFIPTENGNYAAIEAVGREIGLIN